MGKNIHPVYGAGIWTHNLRNMTTRPIFSLLQKQKEITWDDEVKNNTFIGVVTNWSVNFGKTFIEFIILNQAIY